MDRYEGLRVVRSGRVLTITLDRPDARNAVDEPMHADLARVWSDADRDDDVDVVVLTGTPPAFCAGGDINWLLSIVGDPVRIDRVIRNDRRILDSMLAIEKPVIARVDGPAVGLGCSLALCCDFVYATERSVFADPHVSVGLVAGDGGALLWPYLVGFARAKRYVLTGEPVGARQAAEIGLITECVADEQALDRVVEQTTNQLLASSQYAVRFTKASMNAGLRQLAAAVVDRAAAYEAFTMMTDEHRRALEGFLSSRGRERPSG
jgi:enoyl-CoA hydratase